MTVAEALRSIQARLHPVLGELAGPDAELILQHILNQSRTELYVSSTKELDTETVGRIGKIVERRLNHEPLQYILERAFFFDREYLVNPRVLIPRPDTETLIEEVLSTEPDEPRRFADIGTGSGILASVLTGQRPTWTAVGVDISPDALETAARNCGPEVKLLCADMLSAFNQEKLFDFIISNPPYISARDMARLDRSVAQYEPHLALYGGEDGLDFYRILSRTAPKHLVENGRLYLEIGYDQGESVPDLFRRDGWAGVSVQHDLAKRPRVVKAQWKIN
ncbi:MAG: peptide chain release factor N(5)-glutamine methyltransferase [Chitinispirillaceae bacterium]